MTDPVIVALISAIAGVIGGTLVKALDGVISRRHLAGQAAHEQADAAAAISSAAASLVDPLRLQIKAMDERVRHQDAQIGLLTARLIEATRERDEERARADALQARLTVIEVEIEELRRKARDD